ncbi:hypothetical protein PE066_06295 [Ramlibacter tataouinensis]|uniref:hypothetical protein n=1 Tax=Ramlibacter tataouinensis TaxID=94132 RepID=UPI0022F380C2|nr:hypothetical protein [Ramlibacter tataouinensis]WBY03140.1 hypothetical protein PE066_06295 [Ramlibacter tataouinensis]
MKMKILGLLLLLPAAAAHSGSIYLCKAYSGGTFWAQAHCNQHNALIESIVSVPDGLPWDQQVALAEQQRNGSHQQHRVISTETSSHAARQGECKALDARITHLDAMARQPQGAQTHDWIRSERKAARDPQFALRCQ